MREVIVDTETTGLSYKGGDRIIEVGAIELINHIATGNNLHFYCSTDKTIGEDAQKIHGLTNAFLHKHPKFSEQSTQFLNFIKSDTLVIHNAEFDLGFLNNELMLSGKKTIQNKIVDTLVLARKKLSTRMVSLDNLCKRFSVDISERKQHNALLDCQLLSEVYIELLGGRQTNLGLDNAPETNYDLETSNSPYNKDIYKIQISKEETKQHKEFVLRLKGSLWDKIDY